MLGITIGDKGSYAYVNFGALSAHEDDSRRAVKTALELRNKTELQLQMGITQGLMRVGAYGGATRRVYGALGDDVNLAARLEPANKTYDTLVMASQLTLDAADSAAFRIRVDLQVVGQLAVKGAAGRVDGVLDPEGQNVAPKVGLNAGQQVGGGDVGHRKGSHQ